MKKESGNADHPDALNSYWTLEPDDLIKRLRSRSTGLLSSEAAERLIEFGANTIRESRSLSRWRVLWAQIKSPLLLLLVFAVAVGALAGEWINASIVMSIIAASITIGYTREYRAHSAVDALRAQIQTRVNVLREERSGTIPLEEIVPGDVVLLSAGSLVPADGVILSAKDFYLSEAVLTGESFPVQKKEGGRIFLGTNVRSGAATCLVVRTGAATNFGSIANRLKLLPPETEFDRGIRRFGTLLMVIMFVMVFSVFVVHTLRGRPPIDTLLFAIALAVGLSPELLPAILSVNLARGATMMARHGVLVRRLSAIENLGSMDVLCTDKTGTLTEGIVSLEGAYDAFGQPSTEVLEMASWNASLETGLASPLDDAILKAHQPDLSHLHKLTEIPFDFVRKRVSVVIDGSDGITLVAKGVFSHLLNACTNLADGSALDLNRVNELEKRFTEWSRNGIRVLAVATRKMEKKTSYDREDEHDLVFRGFLTFLDQPKEGAAQAVSDLAQLGVSVKLITGDNKLVAQHLATLVGLRSDRVLTGANLDELNDEALWHAAPNTDLFVEVDPNQKERILLSLKKMGHVVGFLGDGVNDAPAMHAADTSLSVKEAVDVAREAADFVLLERDLDVIRKGIEEGRRTFANTLKYILTTTSANLGNMVSMAAASLFLPFLPLLASQILLNNFLSDIPAIGLADDSVDPELVGRPRRWDVGFIGRFMVEFGLLSTAFDLLTFGLLLFLFKSGPDLFRTAWFAESLLTELVIALVVRTRRPFYQSRPGKMLLISTLALIPLTLAIPYLPYSRLLGFIPLPIGIIGALVIITAFYVLSAELMKQWFYRKVI